MQCSVQLPSPVCAGDELTTLAPWDCPFRRARLLGEEQFRAREALAAVAVAARDQDLAGGQRRRDRTFACFGERLSGARELCERVRGRVEQFRARRGASAAPVPVVAARDQDLPEGSVAATAP